MMLKPEDIRIDCPDLPAQGMTVGSNSNRVRVTHIPTGTIADVNAGSQWKSRTIALEMVEWALTYRLA